MSWNNELVKLYDAVWASGDERLEPVGHISVSCQAEIEISEDGKFLSAKTVDKQDSRTIIPVTIKSAGRTSDPTPHPLNDKIEYVAGDLADYLPEDDKSGKNEIKHEAYLAGVKSWAESAHSHPSVRAVYEYIYKDTVAKDLIEAGVISRDDLGFIDKTSKIEGMAPVDITIRFCISYKDKTKEGRTWKDKSLWESFYNFYSEQLDDVGICYATGEKVSIRHTHPRGITRTGDMARLISSVGKKIPNRYTTDEGIPDIGYLWSEKVHNALRHLCAYYGKFYGTTMCITWSDSRTPVPDYINAELPEEITPTLDNGAYAEYLQKCIYSVRNAEQPDEHIHFMSIDAPTPGKGRLSLTSYEDFSATEFYRNLAAWYTDASAVCFRDGFNRIAPIGLNLAIKAAYGHQVGSYIEIEPSDYSRHVMRLLPCIIDRLPIPDEFVKNLYIRASAPLSYSKGNHRRVLECACGIYKAYITRRGGMFNMGYDKDITDRSYLFGCLLAIADKVEEDTYTEKEKKTRTTNARKFWAAFAQRPYTTWANIEKALQPYIDKHEYRGYYRRQLDEVMSKFNAAEYSDNSALSPMYLLGYHQYVTYLYTKKNENTEEEK